MLPRSDRRGYQSIVEPRHATGRRLTSTDPYRADSQGHSPQDAEGAIYAASLSRTLLMAPDGGARPGENFTTSSRSPG